MSEPRPVWLDESDLHVLRSAAQHLPGTIEQEALTRIAAEWDAAPADPTKAVAEVLDGVHAHGNVAWLTGDLDTAVLRALGMPDA